MTGQSQIKYCFLKQLSIGTNVLRPINIAQFEELLESLEMYTSERRRFLKSINWPESNRDPFSVASELLVLHLLGGKLAENQVQKGWDLIDENNNKVQIKYLANTREKWVNGHDVKFPDGVDFFALVVFEHHAPQSVLVFNRAHIELLCRVLNKRHANQHSGIQLTQTNYQTIMNDVENLERQHLISVFRMN